MKIAIIIVSLTTFFVIGLIASFQGLDLRKLTSWFYGTVSFFCGFVPTFLLSGNLVEGLKGGAIFSFITLVGGATMRWHKRRYERK
jgi:hypothetical protein